MEAPEPHPYEHVDAAIRYEWMRQDCAALSSARQAREDGLVQTITQISSAALLAVPGFFLSGDRKVPSVSEGFFVYLGIFLFIFALTSALLEQIFSADAYGKQEKITKSLYQLESRESGDKKSVDLVNRTRLFSLCSFGSAVVATVIGLSLLMESEFGKSSAPTPTPATTPATTPAAAQR